MKNLFLLLMLFLSQGCASQKPDYHALADCQDNTVPEINIQLPENSKVLAILPHADDEIVVAGLILYFREKGATIHLLTLDHFDEARVKEQECCAMTLGIEKVETAGLINNSWDDILQNKIVFWYDHQDSIKEIIFSKINEFRPDVLITFDKETGAYGHPEHRISGKLTEDIFNENKNDPAFSPSYLLQTTLPDKLEVFLFGKSKAYNMTKDLTGTKGLPYPDVSIDLHKYWYIKNNAGHCYVSQVSTLKKFYQVFEEKYREEHINSFTREYYVLMRR
jgi:N-acetylglucosamine malate deacetylase 2